MKLSFLSYLFVFQITEIDNVPWQSVVNLNEAVLAKEFERLFDPELDDRRRRQLPSVRRSFVQRYVFRIDYPQAFFWRAADNFIKLFSAFRVFCIPPNGAGLFTALDFF